MGVIVKQSIKGSIYSYIGAGLGFISAGFLMPKFFSTEQVGLLNLLVSIAIVFSQFSSLGYVGVINRLFPYFRDDKKKHNGILMLGILVSLFGFLLSVIGFFLLRDYLIESNLEKSPLFSENVYYLLPFIFATLFFNLLDSYMKAMYDAATGLLLKDLIVRIMNIVIILLFYFNILSFEIFLVLYLIIYSSPTLLIMLILIKRNQFFITGFNLKLISEYKSEIIKIGGYYLISGFSVIATMSIDKYMVNYYIGLSVTGIYSIAFNFGNIIALPSRALKKISTTVIAEAWRNNDTELIADIYKRSSINQFIIALLLFIGLWANIDNVFRLLPDYSSGRYVIFYIGITYVLDMLFGLDTIIMSNSKYYKNQAYIMLISLVLIIVTNIIFIPIWGISGAAAASALSMLISSLIRYAILYIKFRFVPFSYKHILILMISFICYSLSIVLPVFKNLYFDVMVRGITIVVLFVPLIYFSRVSTDINNIINKLIKKVL